METLAVADYIAMSEIQRDPTVSYREAFDGIMEVMLDPGVGRYRKSTSRIVSSTPQPSPSSDGLKPISNRAAYIIYDERLPKDKGSLKEWFFSYQIKTVEKALSKVYNGDIFLRPAKTLDGFTEEWNNMDENKIIDNALIMFHGKPDYLFFSEDYNTLYDGADGNFSKLNPKKIDSLLLLSCSTAGDLDTTALSPYNLATSFSKIEGVRAVLASDGLVQSHINPVTDTAKFKSLSDTSGKGRFVIYANGEIAKTLSKNEYSLQDIVFEVNSYSTISGGGRR
jgi:hypothetical protein